jgi:hypothetical protein
MSNSPKTPLLCLLFVISLIFTSANASRHVALEDMPFELINSVVRFSVIHKATSTPSEKEKDVKKGFLNLGKVSKAFYRQYLLRYIVGHPDAGQERVSEFRSSMTRLLEGIPINFLGSKGLVGSFNFEDEFSSMELVWTPGSTTSACLSGRTKGFHCGQLVNISGSSLTPENRAWPFAQVTKVTYHQYVSNVPTSQELQEMFPNEPWYWSASPCGMATYNVLGRDHANNEISVSYEFYKPSI